MVIDERKVNLAEADIEQWLWENPGAVVACQGISTVERWIHRQFRMGSGIADLIGVDSEGNIVVVEVKNGIIGPDALTQVRRYAKDLDEICMAATNIHRLYNRKFEPYIFPVVVGKGIHDKTLIEAQASNVEVVIFSVALTLSLDVVEVSSAEQRRQADFNEKLGSLDAGQQLVALKVQKNIEHSDLEECNEAARVFLSADL